MRAVKAVQVPYQPTERVLGLLKAFRGMVNYCIHVGLEKNVTSRFRLQNEVYHKLTENGLHSWYVLSAVEVATSILRNYRKAVRRGKKIKKPYVKRPVAKLGNQAYKVVGSSLRIPIKPRRYFYVKLHKRALQFLSDSTLKMGSITLTARQVVVVFSKTAEVVEPKGHVAFDTNEKSIDGVTSDVEVIRYDLSRIYEDNSNLFERTRRFQQKRAKDRRVQKKIVSKWYEKRNNRVDSQLHRISKEIVEEAKSKGYGIRLEDLKGIKKAVNRKEVKRNNYNGRMQKISIHSKRLKRRLNQSCMRKLQHFIKYKALWEGVKVIEVNPRNTSSKCAICGSKLEYLNVHYARCPKCGLLDRQLNASINLIQNEGVRFTPNNLSNVAVIRPLNKAESKREEVKLSVTNR